jgi:hypothetical protein
MQCVYFLQRPPWRSRATSKPARLPPLLRTFVEAFPDENTIVGIIPTAGTAGMYLRQGHGAQPADSPALYRWVKITDP